MRNDSTRYLFKMILFSLFLSTLPVIALGIMSYLRVSETVQEKISESNMDALKQTQMRVEQVLYIADSSLNQYVSSEMIIGSVKNSYSFSDFQKIREIRNSMSSIPSYELGIRGISLISIQNDWVIDNEGFWKLSETNYNEHLMGFMKESRNSFWILDDKNLQNAEQTSEDEKINSFGVNLVKKIPSSFPATYGMLIVKMPCQEISQLLMKDKKFGAIMVLDQDFNVIANSDRKQLGDNIGSSTYVQRIKSEGAVSGQFKEKINNEQAWIGFHRSEYNGWIYVSIMNMKDISDYYSSIAWITVLTCVVILILTFLISFFGTKRIYSPIKKLYDIVIGTVEENLSERPKDEIESISRRFQTLLKSNFQMTNQLEGQLRQLGELFIIRLVSGQVGKEEVADKLALYGFSVSWKYLCVLAVQIDTLEGTDYTNNDIDMLLFAVNNITQEVIPENSRFSPTMVGQLPVCIICSENADKDIVKQQAFEFAKTIQKKVKQFLNLNVSIGVSYPYSNAAETAKAFDESTDALKYRIRMGKEAVLYIGDVQPGRSMQPAYPKHIQNELLDCIKTGNIEQVNVLLNKFIEVVFQQNLCLYEYQIYLAGLLVDIVRLAQDSGENLQEVFGEEKSLLDQLLKLKTVKEVEGWFKSSIVDKLIERMEEHRKGHYREISKAIIKMIREEYETDLTLERCAEVLNYHSSYVKRVFKKETGVNFSDFLSQYRLSIAKQWLEESDMKISEIAERLRYNNPQNFIRYFRKMEGITPGQFREAAELRE